MLKGCRKVAGQVAPKSTLRVTENYRDRGMMSFGGRYRLKNDWTLSAGFGWDE